MSKAKFEAAKELIQERKFDEARAILQTIEHPTATKWLGKLDAIDPPFPDIPTAKDNTLQKISGQGRRDKQKTTSDNSAKTQKPQKARRRLIQVIVAVFVMVILISAIVFVQQLQIVTTRASAHARMDIYCINTYVMGNRYDECREMSDWLLENAPDELVRCYHDDAISRCIGIYYYETGWDPPE